MPTNRIFKSEEGKTKVLDRYNQILSFFPVSKRYVDTIYGKTFALEAGSPENPAVILLHGSCSNSAFWIGDILALAEKYHVFALDIIGEAGNSAQYRPDPSSGEHALWLGEALDGLRIDRAIIIGNSFGGWLALQFASRYPSRVATLVLTASSGIVPARPAFIARSVAALEEKGDSVHALGGDALGGAGIPPEALAFMNLILENFNPMTGDLPVCTDDQLRRLTMPVLFIAGEDDAVIDAQNSAKRLSDLLPNARIHLIANCGHVIAGASGIILPYLNGDREV